MADTEEPAPPPELSEQDKAAIVAQRAVRCRQGRHTLRALRKEREEDRKRVPNSGWSYDHLQNVLLCSCDTAPAPRMISPNIVFSIDSEVAECVVSQYEGERHDESGLYSGQGKATFVTGQTYEGQWANGLMHGIGTFTWKSGVCYKGSVVKGRLTGKAILKWPGGNVYDGDVVEGYRQGKGKFVMVKESDEVEDEGAVITYDGMWYRGRRHGHGVLLYDSDGKQKYEGEWHNDMRHGVGSMQYKSGNVYKGTWGMGAPHGEGQMLWHSRNEVYVGEWQFGRQHGKGVHAWFMEVQSGTSFQTLNKYDGTWVDGKRNGKGIFEYADGARYEGRWEDNKKHGMGKHIFPDGSIYKGEFYRDTMLNYQKPKAPSPAASEILISINDLLTNQDNPVVEVQRVKSILLQYMSELKQIFRYYSQNFGQEEISRTASRDPSSTTKGPGGVRTNTPILVQTSLIKLLPWQQKTQVDNAFAMSMIDFWKFAKDCHIPDAKLPLAEIDRIFLIVDKNSNNINDIETVHNPKRKLIYRSFLEGVVRLADYKYQDLLTTSQRLSHCLFHNILPYACQETKDTFRTKMNDPACLALVSAYEVHMMDLFKSLCRAGQSTLQIRQLLIFLEEQNIVKSSEEIKAQVGFSKVSCLFKLIYELTTALNF